MTNSVRQLSAARSLSSSGISEFAALISWAWSITHRAACARRLWNWCCRVNLVILSLGNLRRRLMTIERSLTVPGSLEIEAIALGAQVENWRGS